MFVVPSVLPICLKRQSGRSQRTWAWVPKQTRFPVLTGACVELSPSITDVWNCQQAEFFRLVTALVPTNPLKLVGKTGPNLGICSNC